MDLTAGPLLVDVVMVGGGGVTVLFEVVAGEEVWRCKGCRFMDGGEVVRLLL